MLHWTIRWAIHLYSGTSCLFGAQMQILQSSYIMHWMHLFSLKTYENIIAASCAGWHRRHIVLVPSRQGKNWKCFQTHVFSLQESRFIDAGAWKAQSLKSCPASEKVRKVSICFSPQMNLCVSLSHVWFLYLSLQKLWARCKFSISLWFCKLEANRSNNEFNLNKIAFLSGKI